MKKLIIVLTIATAFLYSNINAQKVNRGSVKRSGVVSVDTSRGKTLDDGTTGVLYKDTIRSSAKGDIRNMNYNTNKDLPPADGGNSNK